MKLSDRKAKLDQSVVALKDVFSDFLNFTRAIDGVTKTAKRDFELSESHFMQTHYLHVV